MPIFKKTLLYTLPLAILAATVAALTLQHGHMLSLINQSFLASLVLLMVSVAFIVLRSGFFTVFGIGFSRIKRFFFRKPRVMESDMYRQEKSNPYYRTSYVLLGAGSSVLLFSLTLTIFYSFT